MSSAQSTTSTTTTGVGAGVKGMFFPVVEKVVEVVSVSLK